MINDLIPTIENLKKEYVLVQAWKKTSNHIRVHNWFSDTLELDLAAINLKKFISDLTSELSETENWKADPLRLVPAPKSHPWYISPKIWKPKKRFGWDKIRPLAYVSLRDQVVATAIMLCLADRVESRQGDTRKPDDKPHVSSYGNRLYCDNRNGSLHHRWGSSKLYRSYFQDYQSFIRRPFDVARNLSLDDDKKIYIVQTDLKQFYDRVKPENLENAIRKFQYKDDDPGFFDFAARVLSWNWDASDIKPIELYSKAVELDDYSNVALPQGLVSAGFFANLILLDFDETLRALHHPFPNSDIRLEDSCRYVDDLRIVVSAGNNATIDDVEKCIIQHLESMLRDCAEGQEISQSKTTTTEFEGSKRPTIHYRRQMDRIQSAVSGGFDVVGGLDILESVNGLLKSATTNATEAVDTEWDYAPVPDVQDDTVARFSAARFRMTYRSIRPLLEISLEDSNLEDLEDLELENFGSKREPTRKEADEDARNFALKLINRWIHDPSNVRLLRIGLDIWPDVDVLNSVLDMLKSWTVNRKLINPKARVAWYCIGELLRAGLTETGLVTRNEAVANQLDIEEYRERLQKQASDIISAESKITPAPWYVKQYALLYLVSINSNVISAKSALGLSNNYRSLVSFRKNLSKLSPIDFATFTVFFRRCLPTAEDQINSDLWTKARSSALAQIDPALFLLISEKDNAARNKLPQKLHWDLSLKSLSSSKGYCSLVKLCLNDPRNRLRNEMELLKFSIEFIKELMKKRHLVAQPITPGQVFIKEDNKIEIKMLNPRDRESFLFQIPSWCRPDDAWRLQLGFLLRYILTNKPDFTDIVKPTGWRSKEMIYRPNKSHWFLRLYGFYNAHSAFGDDWVPITEWLEGFLMALLHWPGANIPKQFLWVKDGSGTSITELEERLKSLSDMKGKSKGTLFLPIIVKRSKEARSSKILRGCVVQTVIPNFCDFNNKMSSDLTLSSPTIKRKHTRHLAAAIGSVRKALKLRHTHDRRGEKLDLLIFPELAVHPEDVEAQLRPFARTNKTLILAGLTYEELFRGKPYVNSALWIIPELSNNEGLQIRTVRQGKLHLAKEERALNVKEFRPCQWLICYPSLPDCDRPWLTGSVCYDATDITLASELTNKSDLFIIPALNKDVKTFDNMAAALHYHMFQLVVVANNGTYGGSSAYWPSANSHKREIFHLSGQPQAAIGFFDITEADMVNFVRRRTHHEKKWKYPPAGI